MCALIKTTEFIRSRVAITSLDWFTLDLNHIHSNWVDQPGWKIILHISAALRYFVREHDRILHDQMMRLQWQQMMCWWITYDHDLRLYVNYQLKSTLLCGIWIIQVVEYRMIIHIVRDQLEKKVIIYWSIYGHHTACVQETRDELDGTHLSYPRQEVVTKDHQS